MKLSIVAEHMDEMFFQAHHQRMNPGIEDHIRAFKAHLRRVTRGEILHMDGGRNHGTRQTQALGDMPLHLRAEDQLRMKLGDTRLDIEIIIGNQRLDPKPRGSLANLPGIFARIGADANHIKSELAAGYPFGSQHMRRVAKNKHAFAGQIGRVNRLRIPWQTAGLVAQKLCRLNTCKTANFRNKISRCADADGYNRRHWLRAILLKPPTRILGDIWIENHIKRCIAQTGYVRRTRVKRRDHVNGYTKALQQAADLVQIIAMAEPKCRWA